MQKPQIAPIYYSSEGQLFEIKSEIINALQNSLKTDAPENYDEIFVIKENKPEKIALNFQNATIFNENREKIAIIHTPKIPPLPSGYYVLKTDDNKQYFLICAPQKIYEPDFLTRGESCTGINIQLYSLKSETNWGIGDFGDLRELIQHASQQQLDFIGLNPLHSLFLAKPKWASPYSPSSRCWLNPIYLDIAKIQTQISSANYEAWFLEHIEQIQESNKAEFVDYQGIWELKNAALKILFQDFEKIPTAKIPFENFIQENGDALYFHALFEALDDKFNANDRMGWTSWEHNFQNPHSECVQKFAAENPKKIRFYQWLQWITHEQLSELKAICQRKGMRLGLYGDLAVGSARAGSDVWSNQDLYSLDISIGAPPDALGPQGQNWDLPPLNPSMLQQNGYQFFIQTLRKNMQHYGILRLDHIMALHRLWLIPNGYSATEGAYVSYPLEHLMAILAIESHRAQCVVIGEDLGIVSDEIRNSLDKYGVYSYSVLYFMKDGMQYLTPDKYRQKAIATVSTHDLPPLQGYLEHFDLNLLMDIKVLSNDNTKHQQREHDKKQLFKALNLSKFSNQNLIIEKIHSYLAQSNSQLLALQFENIFSTTSSFNIPGVVDNYPNWCIKLSLTINEMLNNLQWKMIVETCRKKRQPTIYLERDIMKESQTASPSLSEIDYWLLAEGTHLRPYELLGAHKHIKNNQHGIIFRLWAPNAQRVSVVGDFNYWDGRKNPMKRHDAGIWETFIPNLDTGTLYKFELLDKNGNLRLKADPYAFYSQFRPETASVVHGLPAIVERSKSRQQANYHNQPISIYEVHLGSWRRNPENNYWLSYKAIAEELIPYVKDMGFTHIELMPLSEFPFDGSWGYQTTGLYSPTSRFGTPEGLQYLIKKAHEAEINVILDWVVGHFPTDEHGLRQFDGTALYEHQDPREGYHQDWNTLIFNYGRYEVRNFLSGNALYWIERFGIDGLRVDAVASMIYRDYSRKEGEWIPNQYGGRENLEAIEFLRRTNQMLHNEVHGIAQIAEESTAFAGVTSNDGLAFDFKWNMGWMNDTLEYMKKDPIHRKYHHDLMTFGMMYHYSERFLLPLSHDEVVHGKGSLLDKMPGDCWQKFANLRAYYGYMWGHAGKKLIFMGNEFAQGREWNYQESLDWYLLSEDSGGWHLGVQNWVRDLNHFYKNTPALYEQDYHVNGFNWLVVDDCEQSIFVFERWATDGSSVIVISNFTPNVRHNYRFGVNELAIYEEVLNSDASEYRGSGIVNSQILKSEEISAHGKSYSLTLTVPPLATVFLIKKQKLKG